jgi:predicted nucleic-acid-binding protein
VGLSVADSNVYLRLLLGDVPAQSDKALNWLAKQPDASVLVSDAVLVEVLFLLESKRAYGLKRSDFLPRLLKLLHAAPWRVLPLTEVALELFAGSKLDYVDCLLWVMKDTDVVAEVMTFDKALQKKVKESNR